MPDAAQRRRRAGHAVGDRIADLHTTAAGVARRAGIDPRTLRALIRGERWPHRRVRDRITAALHWPPGELERRGERRDELKAYTARELIDELCRRADMVRRDGQGFLDAEQ